MKRYIKSSVNNISDLSAIEKLDIAIDPNTPTTVLDELLSDLTWLTRLLNDGNGQDYVDADNFCVALGENPNITPSRLYQLWEATETVAVLHNPNFPMDKLLEITREHTGDIDDYYQYNIACNPNATAEILALLSGVRSNDVRKLVAEHPNTSSGTLVYLTYDLVDKIANIASNRLKEM